MRKKRPSLRGDLGGSLSVAVAGALALVSAQGCGAACDTSDESNPPTLFAAGTVTDGVYESSPWHNDLLPFPGGKQYQLQHHLGFTPAVVQIWIGFSPSNDAVAPCAGNSCVTRCVNDEFIWIRNDTCADFWVRIVATAKSAHSYGDACPGIAGSDGGTSEEASVDDATNDGGAPDVAADAIEEAEASISVSDAPSK